MGLDATVFRNKNHIDLGCDEQHATVEPLTGEVYFKDATLDKIHFQKRKALAHRLGNIAAIEELRTEVSHLLGTDCIIVQKFLYSGTHSGDIFPTRDMDGLASELYAIRQSGRASSLLNQFVNAVEELICVARRESNPIVFT